MCGVWIGVGMLLLNVIVYFYLYRDSLFVGVNMEKTVTLLRKQSSNDAISGWNWSREIPSDERCLQVPVGKGEYHVISCLNCLYVHIPHTCCIVLQIYRFGTILSRRYRDVC